VSPELPGEIPFEYAEVHIPVYNLAKVYDENGTDVTDDFNYSWAADWPAYGMIFNDHNFDGLLNLNFSLENGFWNGGSMPSSDYHIYVMATNGIDEVIDYVLIKTGRVNYQLLEEPMNSPEIDDVYEIGEDILFDARVNSWVSLENVVCKWYYYNIESGMSGVFNSNNIDCMAFDYPASTFGTGEVLIYAQLNADQVVDKNLVPIIDTRMSKINIITK